MNLVTGAARGLGLALHRRLGQVPFTRGSSLQLVAKAGPYDAIVHSAVNSIKEVSPDIAYGYLQDNLLLLQELLRIPHRRFVFISSIDVKRPVDRMGLHASTKFLSEAMVREHGHKPLILRPVTLLGHAMRPNTVYRMLTEPACRLFLASSSRFNFVLYRDVCDFVENALEQGIEGTYDIGSSCSIGLREIAKQLGVDPIYGKHHYDVGLVDSSAASRIVPAFGRPSWQTLNLFIDTLPGYIGKGRLRA